MLGNLTQHFIKASGFFPDGDHVNHNRCKVLCRPQRVGYAAPFFQEFRNPLHFPGNRHVADGSNQDFHRFQNRDPAGLQDGKHTGKARHGGFEKKIPKNRHAQQKGIPHIFALFRTQVIDQHGSATRHCTEQQKPVIRQQAI